MTTRFIERMAIEIDGQGEPLLMIHGRGRAARARAQGMQPLADTLAQAPTSAATRREQPVTVALIREMLMRQDAEGYARTCEALAEAAPPEVAPVKCPVLLVAGDEDPI